MKAYQVIGPPGCGKTTHLSTIARRTAEQRGGNQVLIASLTKAAAAEIGGRDTGVPDDNVGTLHSFCYHALGRPAIAETKAKEWNESAPPNMRITGKTVDLDDYGRAILPSEALGDERMALMNSLRARRVPREQWGEAEVSGYLALEFADLWDEWKNDSNYVDFTGLIEETIRTAPLPPKGARVLLFDECQDYSKLEAELCHLWAEEAHSSVCVGDVDQCIYQWRGADPRFFIDNPVPDEHRRVLDQSYRVPRAVRNYATQWIEQIRDREKVAYKPTDVTGEVREARFIWKAPEWGELFDLIDEVEAKGESLMILGTCDYILRPTVAVLKQRGIRIHNPYRTTNGSWNPIKLGGKSKSVFDRMLAFVNLPNATGNDDIKPWIEPLPAKLFQRGTKALLDRDELEFSFDGLRSLFVDENDFNQAIAGNLDWYVDQMKIKDQGKYGYAMAVLDRARKRQEGPLTSAQASEELTKPPQVVLGTCHSVKGGEADNVIMVPDISREAWRYSDHGEQRDGLIRTFYVGLTRAKKRLLLGQPSKGSPALPWLPIHNEQLAA